MLWVLWCNHRFRGSQPRHTRCPHPALRGAAAAQDPSLGAHAKQLRAAARRSCNTAMPSESSCCSRLTLRCRAVLCPAGSAASSALLRAGKIHQRCWSWGLRAGRGEPRSLPLIFWSRGCRSSLLALCFPVLTRVGWKTSEHRAGARRWHRSQFFGGRDFGGFTQQALSREVKVSSEPQRLF